MYSTCMMPTIKIGPGAPVIKLQLLSRVIEISGGQPGSLMHFRQHARDLSIMGLLNVTYMDLGFCKVEYQLPDVWQFRKY